MASSEFICGFSLSFFSRKLMASCSLDPAPVACERRAGQGSTQKKPYVTARFQAHAQITFPTSVHFMTGAVSTVCCCVHIMFQRKAIPGCKAMFHAFHAFRARYSPTRYRMKHEKRYGRKKTECHIQVVYTLLHHGFIPCSLRSTPRGHTCTAEGQARRPPPKE